MDSQTLIREVRNHSSAVYGLAFSPTDNDMLASSGLNREVYVWNLSDGEAKFLTEGEDVTEGGYLTLAFSPNGRVLASGGPFGELKF